MQIQADEEGRNLIVKLCDAALRAAGINSLNDVNIVLNEIRKSSATVENKKPGSRGKVSAVVRTNADGKPDADSDGTVSKTD